MLKIMGNNIMFYTIKDKSLWCGFKLTNREKRIVTELALIEFLKPISNRKFPFQLVLEAVKQARKELIYNRRKNRKKAKSKITIKNKLIKN